MTVAFLQHPCPGIEVSQRFGVNRRFYPPFTLRNGQRWPGGHEGLDFYTNKGTPIYATHDGIVVEATRVPAVKRLFRRTQPAYGENARVRMVKDGREITTIYAHLDRLSAHIRPGSAVVAGVTVIGWSGNTGRVLSEPGYHFHLGVNVDGYPTDPAPLILGGVVYGRNV